MTRVYSGILQESLENVNQLITLIKPFTTQMDDADRLRLINNTADKVTTNYNDLMRFNKDNALVSLQRSRNGQETELVKWMEGL